MDRAVEYEQVRTKQMFRVTKLTWLAGFVAIALKQQGFPPEAAVKRQAGVE